MRSKICRAKRMDNKEWAEGFYFCMVHDDKRHEHHFIIPVGADLSKGTPIEKIQVEIDIETLCDDAGLTDKNGRKIFEGDIVTTKYELGRGGYYVFEVYYNENLCQFALTINSGSYTKNKQYDWLQLTALKAKKIEVIGNVFDNPELLEKAR